MKLCLRFAIGLTASLLSVALVAFAQEREPQRAPEDASLQCPLYETYFKEQFHV